MNQLGDFGLPTSAYNEEVIILELEIDLVKLRSKSLMVCTPCYGGMTNALYTKSMIDLGIMATKYGLDVRTSFIMQESLVPRARNYLTDEFLRSDCTHMMFIDADIGFNAEDVITLWSLAEDDRDIVVGAYPKKTVAWEKIVRAVEKGYADADPNNLEKYVGDYVINAISGKEEIKLDEPSEISEAGTGFMVIRRDVFDDFKIAYPEKSYLPDHVRNDHFDGTREIHAYFDCIIDPETKRYLSEDYYFTQACRALGKKVWLCPWVKLIHSGTYNFAGSLHDLAQLGVVATADGDSLLKTRKKVK
jgi:hypothetical protein